MLVIIVVHRWEGFVGQMSPFGNLCGTFWYQERCTIVYPDHIHPSQPTFPRSTILSLHTKFCAIFSFLSLFLNNEV